MTFQKSRGAWNTGKKSAVGVFEAAIREHEREYIEAYAIIDDAILNKSRGDSSPVFMLLPPSTYRILGIPLGTPMATKMDKILANRRKELQEWGWL